MSLGTVTLLKHVTQISLSPELLKMPELYWAQQYSLNRLSADSDVHWRLTASGLGTEPYLGKKIDQILLSELVWLSVAIYLPPLLTLTHNKVAPPSPLPSQHSARPRYPLVGSDHSSRGRCALLGFSFSLSFLATTLVSIRKSLPSRKSINLMVSFPHTPNGTRGVSSCTASHLSPLNKTIQSLTV